MPSKKPEKVLQKPCRVGFLKSTVSSFPGHGFHTLWNLVLSNRSPASATPIHAIQIPLYILTKTGIRPGVRTLRMPVLHRIIMDIIPQGFKSFFILTKSLYDYFCGIAFGRKPGRCKEGLRPNIKWIWGEGLTRQMPGFRPNPQRRSGFWPIPTLVRLTISSRYLLVGLPWSGPKSGPSRPAEVFI